MTVINLKGIDGCETYVIDEKNMVIGIRQKWIRLEDCIPEKDKLCVFYSKVKNLNVYEVRKFINFIDIYRDNITHWIPLPETPREEG